MSTPYEERRGKGLGDFPLAARIQGYWGRSDVEIRAELAPQSPPIIDRA